MKLINSVTADDYQREAATTAIYPERYAVIYPALGLAEEAGEVAGKIKKILRDKDGKFEEADIEAITKELGDVAWYIAALCSDLNIYFDDVLRTNLEKLRSRKERGTLRGSGDNR